MLTNNYPASLPFVVQTTNPNSKQTQRNSISSPLSRYPSRAGYLEGRYDLPNPFRRTRNLRPPESGRDRLLRLISSRSCHANATPSGPNSGGFKRPWSLLLVASEVQGDSGTIVGLGNASYRWNYQNSFPFAKIYFLSPSNLIFDRI